MRFIRAEYSIFIIAYTLYVINYGLNLVISFDGVSTSCPLWESEWMFSPSKSPQLTAKEESEQWSKLWETWFESLSELIPAVKEDFERLHSDIVLKFHLSKSCLLYTSDAADE